MSKSGPSLSFGPRGFKHTIGGRGQRTTVGLPGTGLHYTVQHGNGARKNRTSVSGSPSNSHETRPSVHRVNPLAAAAVQDRDFLRAVVAYQSCQKDNALSLLTGMLYIADACWLSGVIELRDGNWHSAVKFLSAALKNEAELGKACERNGITMEIAYPITPEVTAHIGPDPQSSRLALVEALQGTGNLNDALKELKIMIQSAPEDIMVALSLAEIAFEVDDGRKMKMSDLAEILDRVEVVDGLGWARDFMRARALERSGALSDAIECYSRAMVGDNIPEEMYKLAWYEMALTYEESGNRTRCRQELSGLYAHDKSFADVEDRLRNRA